MDLKPQKEEPVSDIDYSSCLHLETTPLEPKHVKNLPAIPFQSAILVTSGSGYFLKNSHMIGIAFFPVVLFRNIVATSNFHGSWKRLSWIKLNGDLGGIHLGANFEFMETGSLDLK